MAVSAKDVMALRQRTGMGMMECKKALNESDGDVQQAVEILRAAAKGKMDERTDRAAAEGALAVAKAEDATGATAAMIELNTETDFTARNDSFVAAADAIAEHALQGPDGEVAADQTVENHIDEVRTTTKENASFARGVKYSAAVGEKIGAYLHHNRQLGVLVKVAGEVDDETLGGLAQHLVAADGTMLPRPLAVDEDSLPSDVVEAKRAEFVEEAKATGKPAEIAEKISTGKLNKWKSENTLLGQPYVKDMTGKSTVGDVLPAGVKVLEFVRYQVGMKDAAV